MFAARDDSAGQVARGEIEDGRQASEEANRGRFKAALCKDERARSYKGARVLSV